MKVLGAAERVGYSFALRPLVEEHHLPRQVRVGIRDLLFMLWFHNEDQIIPFPEGGIELARLMALQ